MRTLAASLVVGWCLVGTLQGCSSSSTHATGDDGGSDGSSEHATGSSSGGGGSGGGSGSSSGGGGSDAGVETAAPLSLPDSTAPLGSDSAASTEGGGGDAGGDSPETVDCGSIPALHADDAGTVFCGVSDGGDLLCAPGQECCLGGALGAGLFAPQECMAFGATCTNGIVGNDAGAPPIPVECAQVSDCVANGITQPVACCLQGATAPVDQAGCTYPRATLGTAVVCEPSAGSTCAAGEAQICATNGDCPTGKTCAPGKWKILDLGFCL